MSCCKGLTKICLDMHIVEAKSMIIPPIILKIAIIVISGGRDLGEPSKLSCSIKLSNITLVIEQSQFAPPICH
jgi:glutamine amidotransferase-like uncharacterized protein